MSSDEAPESRQVTGVPGSGTFWRWWATGWLLAAVPPGESGDGYVGTGERLDLTWWVSVALEKPDETPAALWDLGGRGDGAAPRRQTQLRSAMHFAPNLPLATGFVHISVVGMLMLPRHDRC